MRTSVLVVLVMTLVPALAEAQKPREKNRARAKAAMERFDSGKTAYRLRDFDVAITEWREGYKIDPDPVFLFNIAQAYREKRVFDEAISFYESYLKEDPKAVNRKTVLKRIDEMKAALEQQRAAAEQPPMGPMPPTDYDKPAPPPPVDEPPPPRRGGGLRVGGLVVGTLGLVLGGAGVGLGLMAKSDEKAVNDALAAGTPWSQDLADQENSARSKALLANVAFAAGGVAVVTGVVLYIIGVKQGSERVAVVPHASPEGAGVAVRLSW